MVNRILVGTDPANPAQGAMDSTADRSDLKDGTEHPPLKTARDVSVATGIEESWIRFIEAEFKDLFQAHGIDTSTRFFDDRRVDLLARVKHLLIDKRLAVTDVRRKLYASSSTPARAPTVLAVTSGKGGVGKTTVSVNLAVSLAQDSRRVLLVDGDMGLANVHVLAGVSPTHTLLDAIEGRVRLEDTVTRGPEGVDIICGASGVASLANLNERRLVAVCRDLDRIAGGYDFVVIDTGAGIARSVVALLDLADLILVVTSPDISATLDAYGVIKTARENGSRGQLKLLVNLAGSREEAEATSARIRECARRFLDTSVPYVGSIMASPAVQDAARERQPVFGAAGADDVAAQIEDLKNELLGEPVPAGAAPARPAKATSM